MLVLETAIKRAMSVPMLYKFVQTVIAGPMHERIAELIRAEVPDVVDNKVLDVGCGIGTYSGLFSRARYIGLDLDRTYIQHAKAAHSGDRSHFVVGDATRPPFVENEFDYIISVGLYHHLSDRDTVSSLTTLGNLLSAKGYVIVCDAVYPKKGNLPGYVLRRMDRGKNVRTFKDYEALLRSKFDTSIIEYYSAGLLDFIFYRIGQSGFK